VELSAFRNVLTFGTLYKEYRTRSSSVSYAHSQPDGVFSSKHISSNFRSLNSAYSSDLAPEKCLLVELVLEHCLLVGQIFTHFRRVIPTNPTTGLWRYKGSCRRTRQPYLRRRRPKSSRTPGTRTLGVGNDSRRVFWRQPAANLQFGQASLSRCFAGKNRRIIHSTRGKDSPSLGESGCPQQS
jgi:hypothetical protein